MDPRVKRPLSVAGPGATCALCNGPSPICVIQRLNTGYGYLICRKCLTTALLLIPGPESEVSATER